MSNDDDWKRANDAAQGKRYLPALPIEWRTPKPGTGGVHPNDYDVVGRTRSVIEAPTPEEMRVFADQRRLTCASCKHFRSPDSDKGSRDRPAISNFVARALLEFKWKKRFLVDSPENLGRCDQNSELAVGPNSGACPAYKPRRS